MRHVCGAWGFSCGQLRSVNPHATACNQETFKHTRCLLNQLDVQFFSQSMRFKKDIRSLPFLILLLVGVFLVNGCKSEHPNKQLQEKLNKLQEENSRLRTENELLKVQNPAAQTAPSPTPSVTAAPVQVAFEDLKGTFGEKEITQLAQLGVFDTISGKFNPTKTITRAEFVRWLVRANNAILAESPERSLRLPETGKPKPTFSDVPSTHPDFRYIQGMANAGFDIAYEGKTFKPNQPITREQMLAIKVALDRRNAISKDTGSPPGGWTDSAQISKKYWPALYTESLVQGSANVTRTFGNIKTFNPQAAVTRAEAALCASAIGDSFGVFTTAEDALQKQSATKDKV
jgi:hypothetical protein